MVLSASGSFILQGEVTIILAAMKRGVKWSSQEQIEENDPLIKEFSELKESLNSEEDILKSDAATYLNPFLELIRSPNTTGPVTGIALSSINKIVSYGLIDCNASSATAAVENIADAVTHARFLGTDPGSDEVVLLKILHVLRTLFLAPCGSLLTNESVCEIMQSCFRICFEMRLSELLRKTAEHTLMEMTQLLFSRLQDMSEDNRWGVSSKKLKMRTGEINTNKSKWKKNDGKKEAKQAAAKQAASESVLQQDKDRSENSLSNSATTSNVQAPRVTKEIVEEELPKDSVNESLNSTSKDEQSDQVVESNNAKTGDSEQTGSEQTLLEDITAAIQSNETKRGDSEQTSSEQTLLEDSTAAIQSNETKRGDIEQTDSEQTLLQDSTAAVQSNETKRGDSEQTGIEQTLLEDSAAVAESSTEDAENLTEAVTKSENNETIESTESVEVTEDRPEQSTSPEGNQNLISLSLTEAGSTASLDELEKKDEAKDENRSSQSGEDYINTQGVRFMPVHESSSNVDESQLIPYGLPSVRELFRFMTSLINPLDRRNNTGMALVGLSLLSVALETGGRQMGKFQSLLSLVQDDLCRNVLQLLGYERISVVAAASRVCLLLFESLRHHLKFQFENYLLKLIEIVTTESPKMSYNQREMALDSIISLWKIPGIVTELYLNYDCDLHGSDLFEDIVKTLSKNTFPVSGLCSTHLLSLDALLAVIDTIESRCHSRILEDPRGAYSQHKAIQKQKSPLTSTISQCTTDNSRDLCEDVPSHERLVAIKHRKKILANGSEQFNIKPSRGIAFLQENELLKDPLCPKEVAAFIKENHRLDKKMIGEFISNRKNVNILEAFVQSFDFFGVRIDNALRQYLETFRLPGEAALIQLIMEHFADHWHTSNGEPFADSDAPFTLAYAIIMLNVDQHNHNVKKQNKPMTLEEFRKNLKGVNGGTDFNAQLIEEIYNSIRGEEIVMPAEQVGLVKENYLWKVLLKRGNDPQAGRFRYAPNGSFDHDLFSVTWGPTVTALSYVLDQSNDKLLVQKALSGFRKCAMISAHYGMSDVFDNLTISLCNFTMLLKTTETTDQVIITLGSNYKAQMALKTVFNLTHRHGDILREGWKNLLECIYQFYKCQLLNEEVTKADDFVDSKGYVYLKLRKQTPPTRPETGLFSSIYSYIAMSDSPREKLGDQEQEELRETAKECLESCFPEQIISDSKFLRTGSLQELVKALIFASAGPDQLAIGGNYDEDSTILFMELLIKIVLQNRDRAGLVWAASRDHLYSLMMGAAAAGNMVLLERSVVAILRLALGLIRRQNMATQVLQSLRMLLLLKPICLHRVCRQVSFAIHELLRSNATNINDGTDWSTILTLMECVGAGSRPPLPVSDQGTASGSEGAIDSGHISDGEKEYRSDPELYTAGLDEQATISLQKTKQSVANGSNASSSSSWIIVGKEGEIEPVFSPSEESITYNITTIVEFVFWDRKSFLKCVESLSFLVKDAALITPANFEAVVRACRVFIEASLSGGKRSRAGRESKKKKNVKSSKKREVASGSVSHDDDGEDDENFDGCNQAILQLLDLMHALHTRAAHVFQAVDNPKDSTSAMLWPTCWCPLLQGIARLCTVTTRQVRMVAVTYLQRALLAEDLQNLSATEWEACFNKVLFPLLVKLLEPLSPKDPTGIEETRVRVATLLSKVFLQHLTPLLSLSTFTALWLTILDFLDKYMHADRGDLLCEAIPELLKNMLLVMSSAGVFESETEENPLWSITWDRIHSFLPELKQELLKSHPPSQPGRKAENEQIKPDEASTTESPREDPDDRKEEISNKEEQKSEEEGNAVKEEPEAIPGKEETEDNDEQNEETAPVVTPEVESGTDGRRISSILVPPLPSSVVLASANQPGASSEGMYHSLTPSPTHRSRTSPTLMAPLHQSIMSPLPLHTSAVMPSSLIWSGAPQQVGNEGRKSVPLMLNTKMYPTTNLSGPSIPHQSQGSSSEDESRTTTSDAS